MGLFRHEPSEREIAEKKLAKSGLPEPHTNHYAAWAPYEATDASGRRYLCNGAVRAPGEEPGPLAAGKTYLD